MTLGKLLLAVKTRQEKTKIATSDYRYLILEGLNLSPSELFLNPEMEIPFQALRKITRFFNRLENHEPPQYIIGKAWFMGHELAVNPCVLIPRPETELLVELAIKRLKGTERILEIGTGSGAISISLKLALPNIRVVATDISIPALEMAKVNAANLSASIEFICCDLFPSEPSIFDAIISNPPYISEHDFQHLPPSIREHEPEIALKAGGEGLDIYRHILRKAAEYMNSQAWIALEHGEEQTEAINAIAMQNGFSDTAKFLDLNQRPRIMFIKR